jgi:ribosomal protein S18 acetylase RimI-like enzyme
MRIRRRSLYRGRAVLRGKGELHIFFQVPTPDIIKFYYRLGACPELCLGLFIENEDGVGSDKLIGHVIALRTHDTRITDGSVGMPTNWRSLDDEPVFVDGELIGNHKYGENIAIHSVAVSPEYQGKKVGRALVRAYIEYLGRGCFGANKAVLIAHDYLVKFYEDVGFKNLGKSESSFAGGGWFDMVCSIA